jgi:hypothetical protein
VQEVDLVRPDTMALADLLLCPFDDVLAMGRDEITEHVHVCHTVYEKLGPGKRAYPRKTVRIWHMERYRSTRAQRRQDLAWHLRCKSHLRDHS